MKKFAFAILIFFSLVQENSTKAQEIIEGAIAGGGTGGAVGLIGGPEGAAVGAIVGGAVGTVVGIGLAINTLAKNWIKVQNKSNTPIKLSVTYRVCSHDDVVILEAFSEATKLAPEAIMYPEACQIYDMKADRVKARTTASGEIVKDKNGKTVYDVVEALDIQKGHIYKGSFEFTGPDDKKGSEHKGYYFKRMN
jgi:hypothetical protein